MIAVVCRDLAYLKLLHPLCEQLIKHNAKYILLHMDCYRGTKQYNNASLSNIKKSSPSVTLNAKKVIKFSNDKQLLNQLISNKITKLVSVEIWLWAKGYINQLKQNNIKTYSLLYLTDSLWQDSKCITTMDRVYYSSMYLMKTHLDFAGLKENKSRDRWLGSPIFDSIINKPSDGKDILVLLPNLRKEHVAQAFGSSKNFIKIIEKISHGGDLIFKTRKKQWLPNEIKQYAKEIIDDGDVMYPPIISDLLQRCYCTVMFFSSGIYECIYGGNMVYNIPLPLKRWSWDKKKLQQYFSTSAPSVYSFPGVVESIEQKTILGDWKFNPVAVDEIERQKWMNKYIGLKAVSCAEEIVKDILEK